MATQDLTTTAKVKAYLQITASTWDTLFGTLVTYASMIIENYINRKLYSATYTEYYDGNNEIKLFLNQYPISTVTTVKLYDYEQQTVLQTYTANEDYISYLNEGYIYKGSKWTYGHKNFQIVYIAGYSTIPEDIELACNMIVANLFNMPDKSNISAERIGSYSINYLSEQGLPPQVKSILDNYKRVVI